MITVGTFKMSGSFEICESESDEIDRAGVLDRIRKWDFKRNNESLIEVFEYLTEHLDPLSVADLIDSYRIILEGEERFPLSKDVKKIFFNVFLVSSHQKEQEKLLESMEVRGFYIGKVDEIVDFSSDLWGWVDLGVSIIAELNAEWKDTMDLINQLTYLVLSLENAGLDRKRFCEIKEKVILKLFTSDLDVKIRYDLLRDLLCHRNGIKLIADEFGAGLEILKEEKDLYSFIDALYFFSKRCHLNPGQLNRICQVAVERMKYFPLFKGLICRYNRLARQIKDDDESLVSNYLIFLQLANMGIYRKYFQSITLPNVESLEIGEGVVAQYRKTIKVLIGHLGRDTFNGTMLKIALLALDTINKIKRERVPEAFNSIIPLLGMLEREKLTLVRHSR